MDRSKIIRRIIIVAPSLILLIAAYVLPVHDAIMLLLIPFMPLVLIFDACFYLMPVAIGILAVWLLVLLGFAVFKKAEDYSTKTKIVPITMLVILLMGYVSINITSFLLDANLPEIGIVTEE